jgi:2-oxoisovalerate dehydrogenase E2 component (dihydrolipoyl transacylase)
MPAFLLPDLGEGLTEAEIVAWHVQTGDTVTVDQPIVEVETAKAVVEVPVPFAGRVTALHGQPGDLVAVGEPLVTVDTAESGSVLVGYGTTSGHRRRHRASRSSADGGVPPRNGRLPVASPLIRQLARSAGLDLTTIRGSGRGGLITRQDVDAAIKARQAGPAAVPEPVQAVPEPGPGVPEPGPGVPEPGPGVPPAGGVIRIPIRGLRKSVADKLSRSRREIPEATVWVDVDATEMLRLRAALNADESAPKISLLALLSRFTVLALRRHPELNARIEGDEIVMDPSVHLGFAAQTDRGLMVPVVRDAQVHTLEQLAVAVAERTRRARDGTLGPAELTGGTFTVNNYGVFGVDGSAAIINHPEAAILGIGRIIPRPWVVDDQVVPRQVTELTLAFDHRVCDGGTAGGFLRFIADCVESPAHALRHL